MAGLPICLYCKTEDETGFAKYCKKCGKKMGCSKCGETWIESDMKFCPKCGADLYANLENANTPTPIPPAKSPGKIERSSNAKPDQSAKTETLANLISTEYKSKLEIDARALVSRIFDCGADRRDADSVKGSGNDIEKKYTILLENIKNVMDTIYNEQLNAMNKVLNDIFKELFTEMIKHGKYSESDSRELLNRLKRDTKKEDRDSFI